MSKPVEDAIAQLKASKNALLLELRQVDDALLALGALNAQDRDVRVGPPKTTLKAAVLRVMEEQDQAWGAAEIAQRLQAEGFPLNEDDPLSGIRTSFTRLNRTHEITSVGYGTYKASKWIAPEIDPAQDREDWADYEPSEEELAEELLQAKIRSWYDPAEEPF